MNLAFRRCYVWEFGCFLFCFRKLGLAIYLASGITVTASELGCFGDRLLNKYLGLTFGVVPVSTIWNSAFQSYFVIVENVVSAKVAADKLIEHFFHDLKYSLRFWV